MTPNSRRKDEKRLEYLLRVKNKKDRLNDQKADFRNFGTIKLFEEDRPVTTIEVPAKKYVKQSEKLKLLGISNTPKPKSTLSLPPIDPNAKSLQQQLNT